MEAELPDQTIEKIRIFDQDIRRFDHQAKTVKELIRAKVEELPEYATVESLSEQLKEARKALKQAKLRLPGYNDLCNNLADEQDALKNAKLNLSDFLLGYFAETKARQIALEPKDEREVILKARLGKPKDDQLNLLTQGSEE